MALVARAKRALTHRLHQPRPSQPECSERKKRGKSNKRRSAGVESDDKEGMSVVIQRLAIEEDQMGKVMERMQAAQEQQMQLMTQLLGSFNQYMEKKCGQ